MTAPRRPWHLRRWWRPTLKALGYGCIVVGTWLWLGAAAALIVGGLMLAGAADA